MPLTFYQCENSQFLGSAQVLVKDEREEQEERDKRDRRLDRYQEKDNCSNHDEFEDD
ncbi:hypothetical protein HFX_5024 (plasmid) [Haloferax mediterranei ATCC 33500]|uniref:Uncharacterized protein n=1 Tax=Haloferax mediterranei (strain ATCC 33500 / DSM 1411 / JCM 8866 / NBRC 14739 / NCIMB 2177 / R-4) TaxID=523841 RepID=I3R9F1_HALMT|nr:hypothetical protein HFX_5024 [Haloferax mediterranei ATCC 33500]